MDLILATVARFTPLLAAIAAVTVLLAASNWYLQRRWKDDPNAQFRFQLIMLTLSFAGFLAVVLAMPISDTTRGQLLSLIGILLSAAIALSSTTFIGNIMAGIMLRVVRSFRPGDFITVAELTGRVTEMDLLHTEIQTEFRDLVTVPNLYMVTRPLQVVRASGTIITAEVSLGYDAPHSEVSKILCEAAEAAGLEDAFTQVRELGDFSVTYRVAGLLEDVTSLISARSRLRAAMLDTLHAANIEIVSPNFMNTRALDEDAVFIPVAKAKPRTTETAQAEEVAFDKAREAASVEEIRKAIEKADAELEELSAEGVPADDPRKARLERTREQLLERLAMAEEYLKKQQADD